MSQLLSAVFSLSDFDNFSDLMRKEWMKSSSNSKSDVDFVMRRRFVSRTSSVRCFMFVVIADIACHSLTSQTDLSLMSTVVLQSE